MQSCLRINHQQDNIWGDASVLSVLAANVTQQTLAELVLPLVHWLECFWIIEQPASWFLFISSLWVGISDGTYNETV